MKDRTDKGYYRCKIKHQTSYEEFMRNIEKYMIPSMLCMLQHDFSTPKNESLNHSVATLAPKGKDYSKLVSLETRVMLTAGSQIFGHFQLRTRIFSRFHLEMDHKLVRHLKRRDSNKGKR